MRGHRKVSSFLILIIFVAISPIACSNRQDSLKTGEIYRTIDETEIIRVISNTELEMEDDGEILVAEYTLTDKTVRAVFTALGTTIAQYYDLIPEGLQEQNSKTVFYSTAHFEQARENYYCDAVRSALGKLDDAQEAYFKRRNRYVVEGDGSTLQFGGFSLGKGVLVELTGVPEKYYLAMLSHKHCPEVYLWDSRTRNADVSMDIQEASAIMQEKRKNAEQEIEVARKKKEQEARLAQEEKERKAIEAQKERERLAREVEARKQQALKNAPNLILGKWRWQDGSTSEYFEDGKWLGKAVLRRENEGVWKIDGEFLSITYKRSNRVINNQYEILLISGVSITLRDLQTNSTLKGKKVLEKSPEVVRF
jgi:hypothetical protein